MRKKAISVLVSISILAVIITFGRVFTVTSIEERYDSAVFDVEPGTVTALSKIELDKSIFSVNKLEAIENIEKAFPDNSVVVLGIERKFPNKVIIYCKERIALMAIKVKNQDSYALADIDFQLNKIVENDMLDNNLISVVGVEVEDSFNIKIFSDIRLILKAYVETGTPEYILPSLINQIEYTSDSYIITYENGEQEVFDAE